MNMTCHPQMFEILETSSFSIFNLNLATFRNVMDASLFHHLAVSNSFNQFQMAHPLTAGAVRRMPERAVTILTFLHV